MGIVFRILNSLAINSAKPYRILTLNPKPFIVGRIVFPDKTLHTKDEPAANLRVAMLQFISFAAWIGGLGRLSKYAYSPPLINRI